MEIPCHFAGVLLDAFVVMPNHVHGILVLNAEAQHAAPLPRATSTISSRKVIPGSLSAIVRSFKSAATKHLHNTRPELRIRLWQRNYYEHVVRSGQELETIRRYIWTNAERWAEDEENPMNLGKRRQIAESPFL